MARDKDDKLTVDFIDQLNKLKESDVLILKLPEVNNCPCPECTKLRAEKARLKQRLENR